MPSRRNDIRMTPEEQLYFLESQPFGVLGTIGPTGYPHLVNVGFALDGPATVVMHSFAAAQKVCNVRRSPQASLLVETTAPYGEIRGILMRGLCNVVDDRERLASWYYRMKEEAERRPIPPDLPPIDDERLISKRVLLILSVEHVVSWDHRKLAGVY